MRFCRSLHMPYLQSETIEAVAYDERDHLLKTRFRADGRVMIYEDVPQEIYDSLIFADSISDFFQEKIEGTYRAHEVVPAGGVAGASSLAASHSRSRATFSDRVR
jgi:hypothetical protein